MNFECQVKNSIVIKAGGKYLTGDNREIVIIAYPRSQGETCALFVHVSANGEPVLTDRGHYIEPNAQGTLSSELQEVMDVAIEHGVRLKAIMQQMQQCEGDATHILEAMRAGNFFDAGLMFYSIPTPRKQFLTEAFASTLPEGSKVDSVLTAVMMEPSFSRAYNRLVVGHEGIDFDDSKDVNLYRFARLIKGHFNCAVQDGLYYPEGKGQLVSNKLIRDFIA